VEVDSEIGEMEECTDPQKSHGVAVKMNRRPL
jgi:hypothetical protein